MSAQPIPHIRRSVVEIRQAVVSERERDHKRRTQIDRAAAVLDALDVRQAAQDRELKMWQARKAATTRKIAALEERVLTVMADAQFSKLEGWKRQLISKLAPPSLIVKDDSRIPGEFMRVKYEADKNAIKKALAGGMEVEGVQLVQNVTLQRK